MNLVWKPKPKKKIKRKWAILVGFIAIILVALFSLNSCLKYNKLFDKQSSYILENPKNYNILNTMKYVGEEDFDLGLTFLCGAAEYEDISFKNGSYTIVSEKSWGDVRLVVADSKDKVVFDEKLQGSQTIELKSGEYDLYVVGKWYRGNIKVKAIR